MWKQLFKTNSRFSILLSFLLISMGCGDIQFTFKEQRTSKALVKASQLDHTSSALRLATNTSDSTYEGSIVFWNQDVDEAFIASILKESRSLRELDLDFKSFKFPDDIKRSKYRHEKKHYESLKAQYDRLLGRVEKDQYSLVSDYVGRLTEQWLQDENVLSPELQGVFCDGSWVDMLINTDSLPRNYALHNVIVPMKGVCLNYYKKNGFLETDSCKPDQDSYVPCYADGLLKLTSIDLELRSKGTKSPSNMAVLRDSVLQIMSEDGHLGTRLRSMGGTKIIKADRNYFNLVQSKDHTPVFQSGLIDLGQALTENHSLSLQALQVRYFASLTEEDLAQGIKRPFTAGDRIHSFPAIKGILSQSRDLYEQQDFEHWEKENPALFGTQQSLEDALGPDGRSIRKFMASSLQRLQTIHQEVNKQAGQTGWVAKKAEWLQKKSTLAQTLLQSRKISGLQPFVAIKLEKYRPCTKITLSLNHQDLNLEPLVGVVCDPRPFLELKSCVPQSDEVVTNMDAAFNVTVDRYTLRVDLNNRAQRIGLKTTEPRLVNEFGIYPSVQSAEELIYQPFSNQDLFGGTLILSFEASLFNETLPMVNGDATLLDRSGQVLSEGTISLTLYGDLTNQGAPVEAVE